MGRYYYYNPDRIWGWPRTYRCQACGIWFTAARTALTCTPRCRQRLHRRTKTALDCPKPVTAIQGNSPQGSFQSRETP
jgi:hypothetical protein